MQDTEIKQTCKHTSDVLRQKREQLISEFIAGEASDFMAQHTRLLDDYFRESFEKSMVGPGMGIDKNPYAIIALGGYGRQEQCVHSDVDILFLFKKDIPEKAEALIREIIYPLWDIGLDIGHATRSLKECISLAGKDVEVLTSVLDARFICGMSPLYSELVRQLNQKIIFRRANKISDWLLSANRERHRCFGNSSHLLEPNLKEGRGGLRDYHTMLWLARIRCGLEQPRDLEYHGCLSHNEFKTMWDALGFIWRVRSGLHFLMKRKYDRLHFEYQVKLADMLNYTGKDGQHAVEGFLGDLHSCMGIIRHNHLMLLHELGKTRKWLNFRKSAKKQTAVAGLEIKKEMLFFTSAEEILNRPILLIRIFEEGACLRTSLSPEARRLVREFAHLMDDSFRSSDEVVEVIEQILSLAAPDQFDALCEMLNTGALITFIPEMAGVCHRIEYDTYHVDPVARHLVRTVQILRRFGTAEDPTRNDLCGELYYALKDKKHLLWAALLHDIGKAQETGNHSHNGAEMARRILARMGYSPEDSDTVAFLIREHLFLSKTATRRDIGDEETALFCARKIGDTGRLKMLYLLSVADLIATGPKAWDEWTEILLRDLFLKVLKVLEKGDLACSDAVELTLRKRSDLLGEMEPSPFKEDMDALFNVMSPRYLLSTPASEIRKHIRLYKALEGGDFIWDIERAREVNTRKVTVCGKNVPGFFSKVAGVFALNRINILDAQIYTWRNNVALNIFQVTPPPDPIFEAERWDRTRKALQAALSGETDLAAALDEESVAPDTPPLLAVSDCPHQVSVDNTGSGFFTIIEVFTCDIPGLLFRLTDALFRCKLDIWSAQISTAGDRVVDVFYVRDFDGRKVDSPDQILRIRVAINAVLSDNFRKIGAEQHSMMAAL